MPDIDNSQFHDTMEKKDTSSKLSPAKEKLANGDYFADDCSYVI